MAGDSDIHNILEAFFMNPEKVSSYTDEKGIHYYFDEGKTVSVEPDGILHYSSHETDGISLEMLFGWNSGEEEYDIFDYFGAAFIAAHTLRKAYSQTNCDLYISGIYYDGADLKICFGYAAAGFPLYFNGASDMMSFTFSADMLKSAEYHFWTVHTTAYVSDLPDLVWTLRSVLPEEEEQQRYFYGYHFSKNQTRTGAEILGIPQ